MRFKYVCVYCAPYSSSALNLLGLIEGKSRAKLLTIDSPNERTQVDNKEDVVCVLDIVDRCLAPVLKLVSINAPVDLTSCPQNH